MTFCSVEVAMQLEEQQHQEEEVGVGGNLPPLIIAMARLSSHTHPDPSCSSLPGESCIFDLPSVHTAILRQDSETPSMDSAVSSPTSQTSIIETDQESSLSSMASARSVLESCPSSLDDYLDTLQQAQDARVSVGNDPAEEFTDLPSSSENELRQVVEETRASFCSADSGDLPESQEARISCRSFESDRLMQAMQSKDAMAFVKNGPTQFMESPSLSEVQWREVTEGSDEFTGLPSFGHETAIEHGVPCPPIEDMQRACPGVCRLDEPQVPQRSLSRASSLSAKALEYVPKTASVSNGAPAMLTDVVHDQVVSPLMIPHSPSLGVLHMFPTSSHMPSGQLGGYASSMAGPPPPSIPASVLSPLLGSLPSGVFNVQKPPTSTILSSSASVLGYPQSGPMVSQSLGVDVEATQDKHEDQAQDLVPAANINSALTEELKAKIIKQVEYYFSDANLPTDHHLMKFVKKDAEGFVPISIVANFRRVKNLLKNHALVATALQSSKQLFVSEDGRKVRRLHPLPHVDLEEIQSRTVVAENLPEDHSIESMERLFGSVGNVKMVRICQPESANGANQTFARFMKADMVVSNKLHALIEYESVEQAERAVDELTDKGNWRSGLHVRLLLRRTFQNKHGHQQPIGIKAHKLGVGGDLSDGEEDAAPLSGDDKTKEESHLGIEKSDEPTGNETAHMEKDGTARHGRGRGRGRGKGRGQFHPNGIRHHPMGTPPQASNFIHFETKPPPGPRMPDGTRGFTLGRGKVTLLQ